MITAVVAVVAGERQEAVQSEPARSADIEEWLPDWQV